MPDNFEIAHQMTSRFEGGYVNNPNDGGGETIFGVARVFHPEWPGWAQVDQMKGEGGFPANVNADESLKSMAKEFYRHEFWEKISGDELPPATALSTYDMAVNFGVKTAIRQLQVALGVTADGIIGQKTIKAAHDAGITGAKKMIVGRIKRHFERVAAAPDQQVFLDGWIYRCVGLAIEIGGTKWKH